MYLYLVGFKGVILKFIIFLYNTYSVLKDIKDKSFKRQWKSYRNEQPFECERYQNLARQYETPTSLGFDFYCRIL